ncbi:MAG: hypothetical protein K0Q87_4089 [Neobacillus sp.]|nr:hypothetical protein [Neobacillus sp.]
MVLFYKKYELEKNVKHRGHRDPQRTQRMPKTVMNREEAKKCEGHEGML